MPQLTTDRWQDVCQSLKSQLGDVAYESWLQPLGVDFDKTTEQQVCLQVPTKFIRDWVRRHYQEDLKNTLTQTLGAEVDLAFNVVPPPQSPSPSQSTSPETSTSVTKMHLSAGGNHTVRQNSTVRAEPQAGAAQSDRQSDRQADRQAGAALPAANASHTAGGTRSNTDIPQSKLLEAGNALDPRFTFETFVTGKANEFAYAAGKRIAESEDAAYNPFILYGGVGLGKTHLMHAMAWHIQKTQPNRHVLYISSEKFVYQFIRSLRDKKTIDFKEAFRSVDVLMIDDIQFIAGKEATQEEFFHTLNALIDMRKQVILTADKSPHEMDNLEDRLRSRLGWGLTTEIHKPDLETRLAILDAKAQALGVELPQDVAMVLADRISSNVRELEGALNRLVAHADLVGCEITLATAQNLLKDIFMASSRLLTIDEIQLKVADYYRIKHHEMHTARRSRDVARPRQIAMYLAKHLTSRSFPDIGKNFGGRDHTTVMHAVKNIEKLAQTDKTIAGEVKTLENMLTGSS